jgi:hypothetical protein
MAIDYAENEMKLREAAAFERGKAEGKREAYAEILAAEAYLAECRNTKQTEAGQ